MGALVPVLEGELSKKFESKRVSRKVHGAPVFTSISSIVNGRNIQ